MITLMAQKLHYFNPIWSLAFYNSILHLLHIFHYMHGVLFVRHLIQSTTIVRQYTTPHWILHAKFCMQTWLDFLQSKPMWIQYFDFKNHQKFACKDYIHFACTVLLHCTLTTRNCKKWLSKAPQSPTTKVQIWLKLVILLNGYNIY